MFKPDPNINAKLRAAVLEGVNAYLLVVSRAMRETLSKPGGGMLYRVAKGRKNGRNMRERGFHRASRAGQPPAADTGMLRRSWQIGTGQLPGGTGGASVTGSKDSGVTSLRRKRSVPAEARKALLTPLHTDRVIGYRYGSALRYARIDRGWGNVKPRPYIAPTMDMVRDLFQPTMARALQRRFGGST